jgi:type I restriction enzyme M protein
MGCARSNGSANSSAQLGFEVKLWLTEYKLRNNMDAAEYEHVALGLIFLKYISFIKRAQNQR